MQSKGSLKKSEAPFASSQPSVRGSNPVCSAGNRTFQLCSFWTCKPGEVGPGWQFQVGDVPHVLILLSGITAPPCPALAGECQSAAEMNPEPSSPCLSHKPQTHRAQPFAEERGCRPIPSRASVTSSCPAELTMTWKCCWRKEHGCCSSCRGGFHHQPVPRTPACSLGKSKILDEEKDLNQNLALTSGINI